MYEEELEDLRRQNKKLQERLNASKASAVGPSAINVNSNEEIMAEVEGNSAAKTHILSLNGTIGSLRSEKIELAAAVKKQQVRIAYLENCLEDVSKQPRQKQIEIDQLTYELGSTKQRAETEINALRKRVGDLELQLGEARREADEYHRASLESNQELVALGNQLAALKMDQSNANTPINFGAQELYIQQLQTELSQLRKRATALDPSVNDSLKAVLATSSSLSDSSQPAREDRSDLMYKLRSAASKIVQLARENQQLTESNNRLRAELKTALNAEADKSSKPAWTNEKMFTAMRDNKSLDEEAGETSVTEQPELLHGRLSQLEKLQYQLTRQQQNISRAHDQTEPTTGQRQSRQQPRVKEAIDPHMLMSMSSGGGESMQQVWHMLDESMTSYGPSELVAQSPRSAKASYRPFKGDQQDKTKFVLEGQRARSKNENQKFQPSAREMAMNYAQKVRKPSQPSSKPKVRNYNLRDDSNGTR
ncbi:coiled-coil domain-containing protein 57 [Elysia marginata]|uniref:Coiled-coil domain-containing protein 57 n=1 Tax=Elysia marginata TaxID=1093978 RepID=A0AAV4I9K5_9GAST|nr:coiled-coil domain-containing protein 57 [Elysia marginata]